LKPSRQRETILRSYQEKTQITTIHSKLVRNENKEEEEEEEELLQFHPG
jgi:hypothetical protein